MTDAERFAAGSESPARVQDPALDEARRMLAEAETALGEFGREIGRLGLGTHSVCALCGAAAETDRLLVSPGEARCALHAAG